MPAVELDDREWQTLIGIVAQAPWNVANPLLLKIGEQLQRQRRSNAATDAFGERDEMGAAKTQ